MRPLFHGTSYCGLMGTRCSTFLMVHSHGCKVGIGSQLGMQIELRVECWVLGAGF